MEAVASLGIGRLIDLRMPPRYIITGTNVLQFFITLSFPLINTTPRAVAMGITRGIYQGVSGGLRSTIIPSFYGRQHMGQIQGKSVQSPCDHGWHCTRSIAARCAKLFNYGWHCTRSIVARARSRLLGGIRARALATSGATSDVKYPSVLLPQEASASC